MGMRLRNQTFEGDLETIDEALGAAKMPGAVLMLRLKEMQQGTFCGMPPNHKLIQNMAQKFSIDLTSQAMNELTVQLVKLGKEKGKVALSHLNSHLERSGNPSHAILEKLPIMRSGQELGLSD